MAHSLIGGLIADGSDPQKLWVAEPDAARRQQLEQEFGIHTVADGSALTAACEVLLLAVKPQVMQQVCESLRSGIDTDRHLIISIAAGVRAAEIQKWLGQAVAIVRVMPNTPALVQAGAAGLYANPAVSNKQRDIAESILRAVGITVWLDDEASLDAVTALSGSGPAYFFYLMEAMQDAAVKLGLDAKQARLLTLQTAFGAAKMALESADDPAILRQRVTSPGGTTEAAISTMQAEQLASIIEKAMRAASTRADELGNMFGES